MSKALAPVVGRIAALATHFPSPPPIELVCRTDSLAALRAAVDHGAHAVRLRYRSRKGHTGIDGEGQIEFQRAGLKKAVRYAAARGCSVGLEINAADASADDMRGMLWRACEAGISDFSLASLTLALYLRVHLPEIDVRFMADGNHLSRRAFEMLRLRAGITRIVLPRVISLRQLQLLGATPGTALELYGCGPGCRLTLPDAAHTVSHLAGETSGEGLGNAEHCAGDESACNESSFTEENPDGGAALSMLATLHQAGVRGLIIEAPTRSPAHVAQLVATWREAIDCQVPSEPAPWCRLVPVRV